MHAAQAIHYLTRHLVSPDQAVNRLGLLHEAAGLLKIYRRFFPDEFAARNLKPILGTDDLHEALAECLRLVSERLFEIPDGYFDGMACEDLPLDSIPIEPMFGEWWNADIEDLTPLWQVLLILLGEVEPDDPEDESDQSRARRPAAMAGSGNRLRQAGPPLPPPGRASALAPPGVIHDLSRHGQSVAGRFLRVSDHRESNGRRAT